MPGQTIEYLAMHCDRFKHPGFVDPDNSRTQKRREVISTLKKRSDIKKRGALGTAHFSCLKNFGQQQKLFPNKLSRGGCVQEVFFFKLHKK